MSADAIDGKNGILYTDGDAARASAGVRRKDGSAGNRSIGTRKREHGAWRAPGSGFRISHPGQTEKAENPPGLSVQGAGLWIQEI